MPLSYWHSMCWISLSLFQVWYDILVMERTIAVPGPKFLCRKWNQLTERKSLAAFLKRVDTPMRGSVPVRQVFCSVLSLHSPTNLDKYEFYIQVYWSFVTRNQNHQYCVGKTDRSHLFQRLSRNDGHSLHWRYHVHSAHPGLIFVFDPFGVFDTAVTQKLPFLPQIAPTVTSSFQMWCHLIKMPGKNFVSSFISI